MAERHLFCVLLVCYKHCDKTAEIVRLVHASGCQSYLRDRPVTRATRAHETRPTDAAHQYSMHYSHTVDRDPHHTMDGYERTSTGQPQPIADTRHPKARGVTAQYTCARNHHQHMAECTSHTHALDSSLYAAHLYLVAYGTAAARPTTRAAVRAPQHRLLQTLTLRHTPDEPADSTPRRCASSPYSRAHVPPALRFTFPCPPSTSLKLRLSQTQAGGYTSRLHLATTPRSRPLASSSFHSGCGQAPGKPPPPCTRTCPRTR